MVRESKSMAELRMKQLGNRIRIKLIIEKNVTLAYAILEQSPILMILVQVT